MAKRATYADSGVDIELGDDASQVLYEAAKLTWKNREGKLGELIVPFDDFSGVRAMDVGELPIGTLMNIGFDGVGTKMELAERIGKHDTVAYDLFAMVCEDADIRGAEPVAVGSLLDVRSLDEDGEDYIDFIRQLASGYIGAAEDAGVAVVNGEIAELGARVQGYSVPMGFIEKLKHSFRYLTQGELPPTHGFHYNWGAGVVWFARRDRLLTGYDIRRGDKLVGLRERGFRSNGLSLVRKIMVDSYGKKWHEKHPELAEQILEPSRIYTKAVVEMFGGFEDEPKAEIHGLAHITGGGIPGKLGRTLKPSGLGAVVDEPFEPPEIMGLCQALGNVGDREAYETWNMGQGKIAISPTPEKVIDVANSYGIEAKVIGSVKSSSGITIASRGMKRGDLRF